MEVFFVIAVMASLIFLVAMFVSISDESSSKELLRIKRLRLLTLEEFEKLKSFGHFELPEDYDSYLQVEAMKEDTVKSEPQRKNEQEIIADIPKLSVLVSAKIAQEVVERFEVMRIVDVANLLSPSQVEEGISDLHEELRPFYEERLLAHFVSSAGIESLEVKHLEKELAQCMAHGLKAVMQLEQVKPLLVQSEANSNPSSPIQKGRSWKNIKSQHE